MLKSLLVLLALVPSLSSALAQISALSAWPPSQSHTTIPLWPGGAPGPSTAKGPEQDTTTSKDRQVAGRSVVRIGNVSEPAITLYPAPAADNGSSNHDQPQGASTVAGRGAAVVVFPGGSYR